MTVDQLGSLGEIIGALATVATLAYLAVQIRANTRMMRVQTRHVSHQLNVQIFTSIAQSPQLAGVFRRGLAGFQSLEPDEQIQFMFVIGQYFVNLENSYNDATLGIKSDADLEREWRGASPILNSPGGRAVWEAVATGYSEDFRVFVQSKLSVREDRSPSAA